MKKMDTELIVKEWLAEFQKTNQDDMTTFAKSLADNEDTATAIFRVLEDRIKYADVLILKNLKC